MQPSTPPRFFGYGSLVNLATHEAAQATKVTVSGWRRTWRHTLARDAAFLTAHPDAASCIDGVTCVLEGGDWTDLDEREIGYDRALLGTDAGTDLNGTAIYWIPEDKHGAPSEKLPILLSYLDVVVQGYLSQFGEDGVQRFFDTTDGWDAPILNDRSAPRYPRHQTLSAPETQLVDDALHRLGCTIL